MGITLCHLDSAVSKYFTILDKRYPFHNQPRGNGMTAIVNAKVGYAGLTACGTERALHALNPRPVLRAKHPRTSRAVLSTIVRSTQKRLPCSIV